MGQSNSSHSKSEVRPSKSKNDSKSKHRDNCSKDKLKTFSCLAPGQNDESIYYSMGGGSKNKQFNNQNSNGKEQVQQKSGSIKKSTSLFSRKKNNQEEQQIAESYCNTQLSGSKSNVQVIDQVSLQKTDQQTLNMIKHLKLDQGSLDKAPMQVRLRDNQMKAQQQPIKIKGGMTSNTQSSTKQVQNQQIQQFNTQSNGGSSRNHTTQLASQQSSEYSIKNSRSPFNLKRYKESADKQDRKDIAKIRVAKCPNVVIHCWRKFVREELMGKEEFNSFKTLTCSKNRTLKTQDLMKVAAVYQLNNFKRDTMLNFDALKVKPQFSYNEQCRLRYKKLEDNLDSSFIQLESDEFAFNSLTSGPYQDTIQSFLKILQMESPMCKLEQIYSSCTQTLIREQENFWSGFDISKKDLFIDSDNLQGILIYIVSRINYPQIWTELHLIEEYIPDAVQMSNRAFYMVMLKASCEYLINLKVPKTQQIQRPPSIHQSPMITEENEEDSDGEQQATAQSYSMKQFQLNFDQVRRRNISLIISKTSYSARALRIPRNNNHVLLDDEEVGSLQHLGDQNNQNQVVLIGDYNTSSADLNMIDKLNQTHADAYFFDNNCILQDDLIDKIKQQVNKAHMYTVIDTTPSTQSLTSTENTRY
eukprot:403337343